MANSESIRLVGYARVSTRDQDTRMQIDALLAAGAMDIRQEKCSSVGARPELRRLLSELKRGDVLLVYKMDRIARSLKDLLEILDSLHKVGATIRSLTEPLDTSGPIGTFMVQVLGAVAQLERGIIRERAIAGQVAAINRGVVWGGRKPSLDPDQAAIALVMRSQGRTQQEVADHFGVSRSTISRLDSPPKPRRYERRPVLASYLSSK